MEFKDKFIGFVDILGFKDLVEKAESGESMNLSNLLQIVAKLGDRKYVNFYKTHGPEICPNSQYSERSLDFEILQVSDCAILSIEISPAGVINLIQRFWSIVMGLMLEGILCRGFITRGKVFHTENQVIGSGYIEAYVGESAVTAFKRDADERGTPFIEIDQKVIEYIKMDTDDCVKKMYKRYVKNDSVVTAIFPFESLSHSFIITEHFDSEKEKKSNNHVRNLILKIKERIMNFANSSNPKAMKKVQHYIAKLDEQLVECNKVDEMIDVLMSPFPRRK